MNRNIKTFVALVKREYIEHKSSFLWMPLIFVGIMLFMLTLSLMGSGEFLRINELDVHGVKNLATALEAAQSEALQDGMDIHSIIALFYWSLSIFAFLALPFVVLFSLLGSLYEERRDRSILFFKSMPVSDMQEVLAKLVSSVFVAPLIVLGIVIVGQIMAAVILSVVILAQGGSMLVLWPLGAMVTGWISFVLYYALFALWVMPIFAWLLLVGSFAPRMPFVFAVLPVLVLTAVEGMFLRTSYFIEVVSARFENFFHLLERNLNSMDGDGVKNFYDWFAMKSFAVMVTDSLASISFWAGILVAVGMLYGAAELRKRSLSL